MNSQGHGVKGRYGGLNDPYGSEKDSKIVILPIPYDQTSTYQKGSDKGPAALIEASRNMELYDIETDYEVYKKGVFTDNPIQVCNSNELNEATYRRVNHWLKKGDFVVCIGGEHSISYAAIKAHAEKYGKLTVLQLDAHADLYPAYENDPWSHASVMSRVKGIPQVESVVSVGVRSLSSEELPFVKAPHMFYSHMLKGDWMKRVLDLLIGHVYITFDLDVFDCSLMPSTGTPEPGGLQWNETMEFLRQVFRKNDVVGFDIVELCPNPINVAPDYVAAKLLYKMLSYKFEEKP